MRKGNTITLEKQVTRKETLKELFIRTLENGGSFQHILSKINTIETMTTFYLLPLETRIQYIRLINQHRNGLALAEFLVLELEKRTNELEKIQTQTAYKDIHILYENIQWKEKLTLSAQKNFA